LLSLCLGVCACTTVPYVDESVAPVNAREKPHIIGAHGPLTARQSKALFSKMGPAAQDMLQRHLAIEEAVADTPLVAGNRVGVLRDGTETFRAMFAAIKGAKHSINLEYFTFEDVQSDGVGLGDLLLEKRQEGVAINVIYDGFGSTATPQAFIDRLQQAGVTLIKYNPINPLKSKGRHYAPNDRDHRKILVVDGSQAIVGGVNLSVAYQGSLPGLSTGPKDGPARPWRDTDLQIDGPAVAELQKLFLEHWKDQKGPVIDDTNFFPKVPAQGNEVVRIIGSTPDELRSSYYATLLSAIRNSEKKIWLAAAYFVPTHQEMEDLLHAARRGVDIRILVPDDSDSEMAILVQHSRYNDLLEVGAKIYETHDIVLHSKVVVIDGVWSIIGSSNFDHRSVVFNDEVDAVVAGSETAKELENMLLGDMAKAHEIDLATWKKRPTSQKLKESIAKIWQSLL
jgi:cardiolipin synthase